MADLDLDLAGVDQAVIAAYQALADAPADADPLDVATLVATAVIPVVVELLQPTLDAKQAELESARAANAIVRDEIRAIGEGARNQSKRISRAFECIDPDAVAEQILKKFETGGHKPDGRDRAFARMTVRHTLSFITGAVDMSLAVDETDWTIDG